MALSPLGANLLNWVSPAAVGVSAFQAYQGYRQSRYRAGILNEDARRAQEIGEINARRVEREGLAYEGELFASLGTRGIGLDSHAVARVMAKAARSTEEEVANARYLGQSNARNLFIQRENELSAGGASLLGGLTQSALIYGQHLDRLDRRRDIVPGTKVGG